MVLEGRLTINQDGMTTSTRAMLTSMHQLQMHTSNIAHFGVPGYQRKEPVVTSFVEYLGMDGVNEATNTEVGRLRRTENPLDFALAGRGYFQKLSAGGSIELTRDGRMKLDKDGYLRALDGQHILNDAGMPVRLSHVPKNIKKNVHIAPDGTLKVFNVNTNEMLDAGRISVVNQDGTLAADIDVKQGYVEDSNVFLQQEFVSVVPLRRQFEANRNLFMIQSDTLSRTIQELGRPN